MATVSVSVPARVQYISNRQMYTTHPSHLGHGKGNLVSSDTVFIDPYHLVLKSKAPTDAARKIEAIFQGTTNNRDPKTKKAKAAGHSEQSKKEEQLKNETKRNNRIRLERKLQQITESFVTRNVNDKIFEVPDIATEEPKWAVTIKWSHRDPRSASPENAEGEFDPDLLMKYALEMIQLPSGRKLFTWLIRQLTLQRYFVYLFWLIKVKFFETDYVDEKEVYLLRLLSLEYRQIVEMLASRAHAEHEKDFVFKYLPFILTNAVYYGFFYIFPGSRHSTNTRAFKKTVYMQVVQIMHGFQVCPISVKVSWAKLFPEDVLDGDGSGGNADSEGGNNGTGGTTGVAGDGMRHGIGGAGGGAAEDGKEVFPVPFALKASKLSAIHGTASQPRRGSNQQQQHRPGTGDNGMQTTPSPSSLKRKGSVLAGSRPGSPAGGPAPLTVNWDNDSLSSPSPPQRNLQRARSSRTGVGFEGAGSAPSSPTGRLSNGVSRLRFDSPPVSRGLSRTRSSMGNISGIFSVTDDSVSTADGDGRGGGRGSKGGSLQRSSTSNNLNNRNDDDNASLAATIDPFSEENVEQTVLQMLTRTGSVLARHASVSKLASQRSLSHLNVLPPRHGHQNSNKSLRRQASQRSGASSSSMLQRQGTASSLHLPAGGSAALAVTNVHANNVSHASLIGEGDDEGVGHGHADELHIHTATTGSDGNRRMSHNQLLHPLQTTTIVDNDEDLEGQQTVLLSTQELAADPRFNQSVLRTYLKAAPLKPPNIAQAKRQGVVEKINAQQISPQMTLLLAQIKPSGNVDTNAFAQTVRRTIPVSWAPAGGTDTHHRTVVATELHHEISQKMKKAREEYIQIGVESHKTKLNEKARLNKELDKVCSRVDCGNRLFVITSFVVFFLVL